MIKRLTWFAGGVAAGVTGAGYAKKKVRETAAQLDPRQVATNAAGAVRSRGRDVVEAIREGRAVMRQHEEHETARRDGRLVSLDEHLTATDEVYVDGVRVEADRVVVMRRE
jgi:hypothetical protein